MKLWAEGLRAIRKEKGTEMTVEARKTLSAAEIEAIVALANRVNEQDSLTLKLNLDMLKSRKGDVSNDFLFYHEGELIGFLGMYGFLDSEIEISGMVHPEHRRRGVFSQLLAAAKSECIARNIPSMLFIVEEKSNAGLSFVERIATTYDHSEHYMDLTGEGKTPQPADLELVRASSEADAKAVGHLMAVGFGLPEQEMSKSLTTDLSNPSREIYIARAGGKTIAAISIFKSDESSAFFYGFVVHPDCQGRGYGRFILWSLTEQMRRSGRTRIGLEVATDNSNALGLYRSCGFEVRTAYGYYRLPL